MKVRTIWLVVPIVLALVVVITSVFALNYFDVEKSTAGYDYKEQLFSEDEVGTVEITVSDSNWSKILDNPTAEEYVEASVTINGETYDNVGIRAKGNSSLSSVAGSDSERYSLKVDFAQYDSNQTFYGLEKFNLNNNFSDTTQMKEFVSYELMEQLGIATPAHSYVKVMLNGEYYGLMLAVEEIGEAFAKTSFSSTEGFIFKPEGNGSDLAYVSDDVADYAGIFDEVKMNKKTAENNSNIINMMKEISEGDTSSIDIDQIARYFALNTALVSMDSYQGSFKHNYYLYENGDGVFSVIPWDYNMSFGGFAGGGGGRPEGQEQPNAADTEQERAKEQPNTDNAQQKDNAATANGNRMTPPNNTNGQQNAEAQNTQSNKEIITNDNANVANDLPQMNRGGMGGGMMLNANIVTDSNVNFSITEPVSGTTIDARPLLKIILEDEEARALYDRYLEKIATDILTEENVLAITTKLHDLLLDAVDEDPSKFATTEQFVAGVNGEQSLPEFAKQRSESILKQLAGEIEGVSGAGSSGFGGAGGEMNGEMPNFENMPEMNGQMPPNFENGQNGNTEQRQQGNPPEMNGNMPNMGDFPGQQGANANKTGSSKQTMIKLVASLAVVVLAIGAVLLLSRKKYKKG
ncbi:CotH kinase family protein [Solibacillus daqui]|uniref:CotH kinase family protein n=1 Tax=Solibacillus daqui TaxID=2912187 RepID=UPI003B75BB31